MYNDSELITKLQQRDERAFVQLINHYKDMVIRLAYGFLQDYQEAEDIMQEVFVAVYENIIHFRKESNLKTWIYRITINKSINQKRKMKWKNMVNRIEDYFFYVNKITDSSSPQKILLQNEQSQAIEKALAQLPENQRIAFVLHKYEDIPHAEIAQIMNLSIPAVESLIHRAKLNLQKFLHYMK